MDKEYLTGHSGCSVEKIFLNNCWVVRKVSPSISYNPRLKKQMEKQIAFYENGISCPMVIGSGISNEGLFYYDMEFIDGESFIEKLNATDSADIESLVQLIIDNMCFETNGFADEVDVNFCFQKKIDGVVNLLKPDYLRNVNVNRAVAFLNNYDWIHFCKTSCHGDFTLENIIYKNGKIYLIDFLDSFYDCWKLDASKILQDVFCWWSFRESKSFSQNTIVKLTIFYCIFVKKLKKYDKNVEPDIFSALLLNLLRILQYNNNKKTELFIFEQIERVMKKIEELR